MIEYLLIWFCVACACAFIWRISLETFDCTNIEWRCIVMFWHMRIPVVQSEDWMVVILIARCDRTFYVMSPKQRRGLKSLVNNVASWTSIFPESGMFLSHSITFSEEVKKSDSILIFLTTTIQTQSMARMKNDCLESPVFYFTSLFSHTRVKYTQVLVHVSKKDSGDIQ